MKLDPTTAMILEMAKRQATEMPVEPVDNGQSTLNLEVSAYEVWQRSADALRLLLGIRLVSMAMDGKFDDSLPEEIVIEGSELVDDVAFVRTTVTLPDDADFVNKYEEAYSVPGQSPGVCRIARVDLVRLIRLAKAYVS